MHINNIYMMAYKYYFLYLFMYPTEFVIPKTFSTEQYRNYIRGLFNMKLDQIKLENEQIQQMNQETWDPVTQDEMNYDEQSASQFMNFVETSTISNTAFQILYKKAAAKMFSQDLGIGLSILFSYDYLHLFHLCLCDFFHTNSFDENNTHFIALSNSL